MKFLARSVNENLYQSYGDDVKTFLKPIYAARKVKFSEIDLSLKGLLAPNFLNLEQALARLYQALLKQERILIIGDFDADGACASALMIKALRQMGAKAVDFLVPNRFAHGYGLSPEIVTLALERSPDLLITVDNGISSIAGVDLANQHKIDVIITDHHLPAKQLPKALAIINPNLPKCPFASKHLAGVGVAFYLCVALKAYLKARHYFQTQNIVAPDLRQLLDLVALGTIADVVKLDHNNRILVKNGLRLIQKQQACVGIAALITVAKKEHSRIDSNDIAFAIAPRINAAGRLVDISTGIRALLSEDWLIALKYANELDALNQSRRALQADMQQQAEAVLTQTNIDDNPFSISLYENDWHEGLVGIIAGKLCRSYHCPTAIFASNGKILKGSLRSTKHIHIKDLLTEIDAQYPQLIEKFGGHAMAAGMSLPPKNFKKFRTIFNDAVTLALKGRRPKAVQLIDTALLETQITLENAQLIIDNTPWGEGFEEPIFSGKFIVTNQKIIAEKHLKCQLRLINQRYWFEAIAFFQEPIDKKQIEVAYKLAINNYQGVKSVQLIIEQII